MEQPISLSCCTQQAKRYLSHVKVRRPESCQWVVIPDGAKILLELDIISTRVLDASYMSAVDAVCDTASWKVEMLLSASSR